MTAPRKTNPNRTLITGGAMLIAATLVFSLNQGGLTGRATGGAVGCGGAEPAVSETDRALDPLVVLEPNGFPTPQIDPTLNEPFRPVLPRLALSANGRELSRFEAQVHERVERITPEPFVDVVSPNPEPEPDPEVDPEEPELPISTPTLWERLQHDGLTQFAEIVEAAELRHVFENDQAIFTVFAPSNQALEAFPGQLLEDSSRALLQAVVLHHMVPGQFEIHELPGHVIETALVGQTLRRVSDTRLEGSKSGSAVILEPNRRTDHGMVHIVSEPFMPYYTLPVLLLQNGYVLFHAALEASGHLAAVSDPLEPMTVLAISDATFAEAGIEIDHINDGMDGLIRSIVENHVLRGAHVAFSGEKVQALSGLWVQASGEGDLEYSNGVHVDVKMVQSSENGPVWSTQDVVDELSVN